MLISSATRPRRVKTAFAFARPPDPTQDVGHFALYQCEGLEPKDPLEAVGLF